MSTQKIVIIGAVVFFILAAFGINSLPCIPIGLALFAGSFLVT